MSKILIAFFSRADENYFNGRLKYIAKGNTEKVAEVIQTITGGDLFKIEPKEKYSKDYNECIAQAQADLRNDVRPELEDYLDSIDEYDEIYLGYPIYWGTYPVAVSTFLEKYSFKNKVIHPFCTHEGSREGQSITYLKQDCKGAIIKEPLAIQGFKADYCQLEVKEWIEKGK